MVGILQLAGAFVVGLVAGTGIFIVGFFAGRSEVEGTTIFRPRKSKDAGGAPDLGDDDFYREWSGEETEGDTRATPFPSDDDLAKINEYNDLEVKARELRGMYE